VIFIQSRDFEGAKEIARSKGSEFRESRSTALALPDDKKLQAAAAVRTLAAHGITLGLDDIVRQYCAAAAHVKSYGLSVPDAAKAFADLMVLNSGSGKPLRAAVVLAVERLAPTGGNRTLAELADEMIEMKRGWLARGDLRNASFHDFASRAGKIRDEIGSFPLPTLTKTIVFDWLQGLDLSRRSKKNYRMILGELLSYAAQKRFITANPLDELTRQHIKEIGLRG